jgi:hypothetical protein
MISRSEKEGELVDNMPSLAESILEQIADAASLQVMFRLCEDLEVALFI